MIALMTLLLGSVLSAPASRSPARTECTLGRVALIDLAPPPGEPDYLINIDESDRSSLFSLCPDLLSSLPPKIRIASKAEVARLSQYKTADPVVILHIDIPRISMYGRNATVSYSYMCNGLCGAGYRVRYRIKGGVWMRVGKEKRLWVA